MVKLGGLPSMLGLWHFEWEGLITKNAETIPPDFF